MNYRQLQSILKQVKELKVDKLQCKLNAPWTVLVHEWQRLTKIGYWAVECEETREVRMSYDAFYNFDFIHLAKVEVVKPKPKTPVNYTVQLWSLVSSYREILVAYFETVQFQALRQKTSQYDTYRLAMLCKLQVKTYLDVYFPKYTQRIKISRSGWVNDLRGNWIYEINKLINT